MSLKGARLSRVGTKPVRRGQGDSTRRTFACGPHRKAHYFSVRES